jgi:copper chaperone CopZ
MEKTQIGNLPHEIRVTDTARIGISGMTCDNCVRKVEEALRAVRGIKEVKVDRAAAVATVTYDNSVVDLPAMHDALLKSGYKPSPIPV